MIETFLILLIFILSLSYFQNFIIFFKNFKNKNLLFNTNEYNAMRNLNEKIMIYHNFLEKTHKEKKIFEIRKNNHFNENLIEELNNEKSITNKAIIDLIENLGIKNLDNNNNLRKYNKRKISKNVLNRIISNENIIEIFSFNLEDRIFNAILSYNISELLKPFLLLLFYLMIKVK